MGGRGAFLDIDYNNFTFRDGGITYYSIGETHGVKVLMKEKGSVKAPDYSHTANRIYAIVQDGKLKQLAFYGDDHTQKVTVDFLHPHKGVEPHIHFNHNHDKKLPGVPPTQAQLDLANIIRKEFKLK